MDLLVLGVNHRSAPIEVRERLYVPEKDLQKPLELLGDVPEVTERMLLATCNRVEVYAVVEGVVESAARAIVDRLAAYHNLDRSLFAGKLFVCSAGDAVRHVFRVAASLD